MKGLKEYLAFNMLLMFSEVNPIIDWIESKFKKPERWKAPNKPAIQSTVGSKPESFAKWGQSLDIKVGIISKI